MPQRGIFNFATAGAISAIAVVLGVGIWGTVKGGFFGPTKRVAKTVGVGMGKRQLPRLDVHTHIGPDGWARAQAIMDEQGIVGMVNLSGMTPGPPRFALEKQLEVARTSGGRIAVFASVSFMQALRNAHLGQRPDYGNALAEELVVAKQLGAIGLKIHKGLGLSYPTVDGSRALPVDDPGLFPLFEKAGELGLPVAIHTGDPKAFWLPPDEKNERYDELQAHPEWSFHGSDLPSWDELYQSFERLVARHPKTTFIGVHFGNNPEDPDRVGQMLEKYPNLFIDTAARVPEIGRQNAEKMRRFFEKYQDRILFGTDLGVGATQDEMMYGSNGALPPTLEDEKRFFRSTWRYFETRDKQFESPTPIQGRWKIDGLGLSLPVLRKLYLENAVRILRWRPQTGVRPPNVPAKVPARADTK
jgi:predicted TIM-barrel fold metal-dependent hydrolase